MTLIDVKSINDNHRQRDKKREEEDTEKNRQN